MKRLLQMAALALLVMLGGTFSNSASAQVGASVSYQTFYDELSPHGRWIDYPDHGYVWAPNAGADFRPYGSNGHWVWSDQYEWMWVSDYSWGWAPFHYGRWMHDPFYGWVWVPGYEWAPAWVAWRHGGDYYGWAPLRPGFNININIGFGGYNPPNDYWCFAPSRYIGSRRIYNHYVDRSRNVTIINNTTIINNNYGRRNNVFYNGPRRQDAERYAGRITPVRFRESQRPGRTQVRNNEVAIYRPSVQRDNDRRFAPRQIERYDRNSQANNRGNDRRNNNVLDRPNTGTQQREAGTPRNRAITERNTRNRDAEIRRQQTENNNRNERNVFDRQRGRNNEAANPQRQQTQPRVAEPRRNAEPRVRSQEQPQQRQERNVFERRSTERNTEARSRPQQQRQSAPRVERSQPQQQRQIDRGNNRSNNNSGNNSRQGQGRKVR
jgi:hypothetical protein